MSHIGQTVIFHSDVGGVTQPQAAIVTWADPNGERVNLYTWSAAGIGTARHDVMRSREVCPGCWSPLPASAIVDPEEYIANRVRIEVSRLLGEGKGTKK